MAGGTETFVRAPGARAVSYGITGTVG